MSVALDASGDTVKPGTMTQIAQLALRPTRNDEREYDVTRDGQRFLINTLAAERRSLPITVVVNWQSVLDER